MLAADGRPRSLIIASESYERIRWFPLPGEAQREYREAIFPSHRRMNG